MHGERGSRNQGCWPSFWRVGRDGVRKSGWGEREGGTLKKIDGAGAINPWVRLLPNLDRDGISHVLVLFDSTRASWWWWPDRDVRVLRVPPRSSDF